MSRRPVSFARPSPASTVHKPRSHRERRSQMRRRLHLPAGNPRLFMRGMVSGEDLLVAGVVFFAMFLCLRVWF